MPSLIIMGIDASNLRDGGGRTHLREFIAHADPIAHGFSTVIVWGSKSTLACIADRKWLVKKTSWTLNKNLLVRSLWQVLILPHSARSEGCHLLFTPGGVHANLFHPVVTMCRNMLPFELGELTRFGFGLTALRYLILRIFQGASFKSADGVIFLTSYAFATVDREIGGMAGASRVIPHGVNRRFVSPPSLQRDIENCSRSNPFRLLYVSIVNHYKHQWNVVEAVGLLRRELRWPLVLDLVGPANSTALPRLRKSIAQWDPSGDWVIYHGSIPYDKLHEFYHQSDLGIFASSCENMPNILIEMMAAGLPVAVSRCGPMPEILGDAGFYFDPETPRDMANVILRLIRDPSLRRVLASRSYASAKRYSWSNCADETLRFLRSSVDR